MKSMIVINITGGVVQEIHATEDFPANTDFVVVDYDEDGDEDHPFYSPEIHGYVGILYGDEIGAAENLCAYPHFQKLLREEEEKQ